MMKFVILFCLNVFQEEDRCGGKLVNLFTLTASYHRKDRLEAVPVGEVAEEVSL